MHLARGEGPMEDSATAGQLEEFVLPRGRERRVAAAQAHLYRRLPHKHLHLHPRGSGAAASASLRVLSRLLAIAQPCR
jgi:hypothetical protein